MRQEIDADVNDLAAGCIEYWRLRDVRGRPALTPQ
jgi:hypothetical protein